MPLRIKAHTETVCPCPQPHSPNLPFPNTMATKVRDWPAPPLSLFPAAGDRTRMRRLHRHSPAPFPPPPEGGARPAHRKLAEILSFPSFPARGRTAWGRREGSERAARGRRAGGTRAARGQRAGGARAALTACVRGYLLKGRRKKIGKN
jgi:hypothetical protein